MIKVYAWNTNTKTFKVAKTVTVKSTATNTADGILAYTLTVDVNKTNNAWSFDGDSVTAYITDLKAGTEYQVRVKALAAKKTSTYNYTNIASNMSEMTITV